MASNRHLGRIIALQTLYEQDFRRGAGDKSLDLEAILQRNIARYEATLEDKAFVEQLVHGVDKRAKELDEKLQPIAPEWPIDQIARMDRVVLRMGLYELLYEPDVPPKVVINEGVELAKAFGSENSSKFVNGVLGTALRQFEEARGITPTTRSATTKRKEFTDKKPETTEAHPKVAPKAVEASETSDETSEKLAEPTQKGSS